MKMEEEKVVGVFIGAGVAILSFLLWFARWFNERRFVSRDGPEPLPPGSMGWPVIGEMMDFLWCFKFTRRPDDFIAKRRSRYGDTGIYRTHLFGSPTIVSCSPEINKQMLGSMTEDGSLGPGWPSTELFGSSAVPVIDGLWHKKIRRHLTEAFNSPRALDSHLTTAQPIFIPALEEWAAKRKIVAFDEAKALTFRNICDALVSFKSSEILETMETMYRGLMSGVRAMQINIPGTAFHHALKCRKKLSAILMNEVRNRKEHGIQKHDFLQILVDSSDENGGKLNEVEVMENIVSLILGSYESTSDVMTWGLYYLAKYPEVLEKLKEEIRLISEQKPNDKLLTPEDIKSMKYTSKVAEELIRLANVSPFIFRTVKKDNVVINGYKVPKNWKVIIWIRSIHIDSRYFADPLTFNPDRWDGLRPKAGTYNVFGAGPRYCPGSGFARVQVMMFLYHACIKYRWELLNPEAGMAFQPHPKPADGAEMIFERAA